MHRLALFSLAATALCGCGDDPAAAAADAAPLVADAAPDAAAPLPLLVQGALVVNNAGNDDVGASKRVAASLRVSLDDAPVTNAIIRLNPPGAVQTYLTGEALDPSLYTGTYQGYNNDTARILITTPEAAFDETLLLGQSMFSLIPPDQAVPAGADLRVVWTRDGAPADLLRVTTDTGYDSGALADAGEHVIPGSAITGARLRVTVLRARRNRIPGTDPEAYVDFGVAAGVSLDVAE